MPGGDQDRFLIGQCLVSRQREIGILRILAVSHAEVPKLSQRFAKQLAEAVIDSHDRNSKKKSRNYVRRKEEPAPGTPNLKVAYKTHR